MGSSDKYINWNSTVHLIRYFIEKQVIQWMRDILDLIFFIPLTTMRKSQTKSADTFYYTRLGATAKSSY